MHRNETLSCVLMLTFVPRTASRDFASSRMEAENSTGNARETNLTAAQLRREEHDDDEAAAKPAIIKAASAGALATILDALEGRPGLLIVRAGVGDGRDCETAH